MLTNFMLKSMKKIFIISSIVFGILFFAGMFPVYAQTNDTDKKGFSISPPSFDINAKPGDHLNNIIKVENLSKEPIALTARVQNFLPFGDEGQVSLTDNESLYSINSWVKFLSPNLVVQPGQVALFSFSLDIPVDAQPGSNYGAIVFSSEQANSDSKATKVVQEIASIILIRLPGDVVEQAKLINFKSDKDTYTEPKVKLNTLIQNSGSVLVKPTGSIDILDIFGNKIQTIPVTSKNILPNSNRAYDEEFGFEGIGFFKARLNLSYGENLKTLSGETSFVSLYTQRLIPIILLIGGAIVFYVVLRKRINKAIRIIIKG